MTPQEKLRRAILNDEFAEDVEADRFLTPTGESALRENRNVALSAWMSQVARRDINAGSAEWQAEKDALAQGFFKMPEAKGITDEQIHGLVKSHIQTTDDAANLAADGALSGLPLSQVVAGFNLPGIATRPGVKGRLPSYVEDATRRYTRIAAKMAPYRPLVKELAGELSKEMTATIPTTDKFQSIADRLLSVPEQDRPLVIKAIGATGGKSAEERASYLGKIASSMGRMTETTGAGLAEAVMRYGLVQAREASKLTGDEATAQQFEGERARRQEFEILTQQIRQVADAEVDPIKAEGWWSQLGLDVARMIPQSAVSVASPSLGFGANLAYFRNTQTAEAMMDNPRLTRAQAEEIANFSAPISAAAETVSALIPFGRVPGLGKFLRATTTSVAGNLGRLGTRVAAGAAGEVAEEMIQATAPLVVQDALAWRDSLIGTLKQDMPSVDWESSMPDFAKIAQQTWAPALVYSLIGDGAASISEVQNGRSLAEDVDAMISSGIKPEVAEQIKEAATANDWRKADALFKQDFDARGEQKATDEQRAEATQRLMDRIKVQEQAKPENWENPEYVVSVRRNSQGWQVEQPDGTLIPATSLEAAQRIQADLKQTASVEEAEALVQVIDDWHLTKAAEQAETKLTGETVTGTNAGVFGLRDGNTRAFDAKALETIRQQAENIGIATDTQDVFAHVNGSNEVYPSRVAKDAKEIVKRLNLFQSQKGGQPQVITFLHEAIESSFQLGMAKGVFNEADTRKAFTALAPALDPKRAKTDEERRLYEHVVQLARGEGDSTMLRETVSELAVRDVLGRDRKNQRTGLRSGSISRAIEAAAMGAKTAQEANIYKRFRALLKAFSAYLRGVLSTVRQIKQAKDKGKIGEDWNAFVDKVLGLDEVTELEKQAIQEAQDITAAGNMAFSVSPIKSLDELSDAIQQQMSTKPAEKLRVWSQVQRNLQRLRDNWSKDRWTWKGDRIRPISEKRTKASLDAEQAMLQARLEGEKLAANIEAAQARKEAKAEAQTWRDEADAMQAEDWNPRASLIRGLVTLEAMIATLPKEIRGQVGGFVALARKGTEKARLAELQKRVEKMGVLLEKHLKEEYSKEFAKLLDKAAPVGKPGEVKKSKFIVTVQDEIDAISEVVGMDHDDVAESIATTQAALISAETPESAESALTQLNLLEVFGGILDLKNTTAAELESAFIYLGNLMKQGRDARKMLDEARRNEVKEMVKAAKSDAFKGVSGPETTQAARAAAAKQSGRSMLKKFFNELSGFDGVLRDAFGPKSTTATKFSELFTLNSNEYEDIQNERRKRFRDFARELYRTKLGAVINQKLIKLEAIKPDSGVTFVKGSKTETHKFTEETAAKIVADPKAFGFTEKDAQVISEEIQAIKDSGGRRKTFTYEQTVSEGDRTEIPLSQMQAVYMSMALRQPGILEQQQRYGYDSKTVEELESFLTDESKRWREWMQTEYDAGYYRANSVYMRMFNTRMPKIQFYAPLMKNHRGQQAQLDPLNAGTIGNSANPGSIKSRKSRTSSLRIESALDVFWSHFNQMEYWISNAEYLRDIQAVMLNPEVRESVVSAHGEDGMATISAWVNLQMSRGHGKAAMAMAANKMFHNIKSAISMKALALNLSTTLKTMPSVFYSLGEIHMSKWPAALASGMTHWARLWKTNIIQRRLDIGGMPELRDLGSSALPMSWVNQGIRYGSYPTMYADGVFTTYSAAMAYGVSFDEAKQQGASDELAHKYAEERTALIVSKTAQPENWTQKSLFESDVSGAGSLFFMFTSDPRQKLALAGEALNQWRKGNATREEAARKFVAYWVLPGVMFQLANAIGRSLFKGDDDEWEVVDFATAAIVGQFQGLVLLGSAVEMIVSAAVAAAAEKLTGEEVKRKPFWNSPKNPLDQAAQEMVKAAEKITLDDSEDMLGKTWQMTKAAGMLITPLTPAGALPSTGERVMKDTTNLFYSED